MRPLYFFLYFLGLLLPSGATAQTAWPTTQLDEEATVQMPYEGTLSTEPLPPGNQLFTTTTSDNDFAVLRVDLRYQPGYQPGTSFTPQSLNKLYDKLTKQYNRQLVKGKLVWQGNLMFAGRPARATRYEGFDEHYQLPLRIETIWVWHHEAFYQFICSYTLPEETSAHADKVRFFSSVRFGLPAAGQKL